MARGVFLGDEHANLEEEITDSTEGFVPSNKERSTQEALEISKNSPNKRSDESISRIDYKEVATGSTGSNLYRYMAISLLSFFLGGISFYALYTEDGGDIMGSIFSASTFVTGDQAFSQRLSFMEGRVEEIGFEANSLKALSLELSGAVSDLTDLNLRLHDSLNDIQDRMEVFEKVSPQAASQMDLSIGSDSVYGSSSWFVNFGTYNDIRLARIWADRIENEDFSVAIETKSDSNPNQYRVRIINLRSSEEASAAASKLASRYKLPSNLWIDEYR